MQTKYMTSEASVVYSLHYGGMDMLTLKNHTLTPYVFEGPGHIHRTLEISLIKAGHGVYRAGERYYEMHPGDIFTFSSTENHFITRIDEPGPMVNMVIQFEPGFIFTSHEDSFDYRLLAVFFNRSVRFENRLIRDLPITVQVTSLLNAIERELAEKQPCYELAVRANLNSILICLLRHFGYDDTVTLSNVNNRLATEAVRAVVRHINLHYQEELSLDDLAHLVAMNKSYISSLFSRYNGISLWAYLTRTRIIKAMELLKTTDMPILEICSCCGFNSVSNFNHAFKRISGVSPSDFRKQIPQTL